MLLFLTMALQAAAPAAAAPPAPPPPPWTPRMRLDPVTNKTSGSVSVTSADGNSRLVVRCDRRDENVVSIQFIPTPPFAAATPRPVSIAIDGGAALGANWDFPGRGAVVSDETIVTNLTLAIAHGKVIKVHAIDPAEKTMDATFAGPPSDAPIRQVVEACGYTFGVVPVREAVPPAAPNP
ncbi:hypothetical protein GCM10009087_26100 [Sphingomonas oligophenolica]|uniref:Uncharacterized protein n=1 Tax=Sphingomonas oligophenolica TaxID=301154 RepID=A0ABU9Y846_9SPHN